jgi:hypothetical protein
MRVPRIAGVDLLWAFALLGFVPAAVFIELSGQASEWDAYGFDFLIDFFFAALFFAHGTFTNALLHSGRNNSAINRFLITQGLIYIGLGLLIEFFWTPNFLLILGTYYLVGRLIVYLDNQILRFSLILLILAGIFLFSFNPETTEVMDEGGINGLIRHLTDHHFNIIYWLPFFISGMLFGRAEFQSSKRTSELRIMAFVFIGFGAVLHVIGLRIFRHDPAAPSVWGYSIVMSLPAFYAFAIGLSQLLVLVLENWYKKAKNKTVFHRLLTLGRLHLVTYLKIVLFAIIVKETIGAADHSRLWSVLLPYTMMALLLFLPMFKKVSDPLMFFSRVKREQREETGI